MYKKMGFSFKKKMSFLGLYLILVLLAWGIAGCSKGQQAAPKEDYPTKQITYLICFDPGGQSDREARRQQPLLEKILGQKVVIDYKVGGGGAVGWSELVRSKPDGYTIAGFNLPHIILQPMQQQTGYKTEQIVPVALFQSTPLGLAVLNTSPYKTLEDFLAEAKKKPGQISIGGSGTFSGHQFATMRLEKLTGTKFKYVPFTGAAPQITAFLGGHVDAIFGNSDDLVKYKDKIRLLAFAGNERFEAFKEAPTFKEKGIDLVESIDRGVAVPPGTPSHIIKKLEAAFLEIARNPDIQAQMKKEGFVPLSLGHEESKAHIAKLTELYKGLAAELKK
ncbi:Tripartite-type tricarboxylate transporter, receptor component TctC [Thermanaeromonas toyohensis ToBE]|uniref:Tripartite-type tricarboxylate transporter, receptor component TctC n=1 Tax=Thermanaeromonas toyohensis ToBE TaxID=698762 RepID=A0A1W1W2Y2_9FIRM|nr:tripartite tricarboxylate transporter substrate binding protein [Thermanaeromonas toyohensis]SMB99977.1 Tripartite-type tricarboxylate transporter, receptor component TctC [Thermanaeromonas toyohensis ToBE]